MIDLHCHLHFDVDDGPSGSEAALALARGLVAAGVETVACTSHVRADKGWWNTREKQAALHAKLDALLAAHGVTLAHVPAAEHYLDAELLADGFEERVVPYGGSRTLLVELPYQGAPPDLPALLFQIRRRGYFVLLAHVERYPYVVDDEAMLERLTSAGHLVQVNLGSLAGAYTRAHKKAAERLVKRGWASVLASDCHGVDDVDRYLRDGRKVLEKLVGSAGATRLLTENPKKILDGLPPEKIWP